MATAATLGRPGGGQHGAARPGVEETGTGQGANGENRSQEQRPGGRSAPAPRACLAGENQEAVHEGQAEEQDGLGAGEGGDGEDARREGRPVRPAGVVALAQVEDHPPQGQQDEKRNLHARQGGPHQPAGRQGEPRRQRRQTGRQAELPAQAAGGFDTGEVERDAEDLGPDEDAPGQQEQQGEQGRPQGSGGARHEVPGVVGEAEAARQIAGELQMNPAVVERKANRALEPGDLRQQVAQAGDRAGQQEERAGREAARGSGRGRGHGRMANPAKHTQLAATGL